MVSFWGYCTSVTNSISWNPVRPNDNWDSVLFQVIFTNLKEKRKKNKETVTSRSQVIASVNLFFFFQIKSASKSAAEGLRRTRQRFNTVDVDGFFETHTQTVTDTFTSGWRTSQQHEALSRRPRIDLYVTDGKHTRSRFSTPKTAINWQILLNYNPTYRPPERRWTVNYLGAVISYYCYAFDTFWHPDRHAEMKKYIRTKQDNSLL